MSSTGIKKTVKKSVKSAKSRSAPYATSTFEFPRLVNRRSTSMVEFTCS